MRQSNTLIDNSMRLIGSWFSPERPQSISLDWMDSCQKFCELFLLCRIMIDCQKENEQSSEHHRIKHFAATRQIPFVVLSETKEFQSLENLIEAIDTLPKLRSIQQSGNQEWRNLHASLLNAVGTLIDFIAKPEGQLSLNDAFYEAALEDAPYVGPNIRVIMLHLFRKYSDINKVINIKHSPTLNAARNPSL